MKKKVFILLLGFVINAWGMNKEEAKPKTYLEIIPKELRQEITKLRGYGEVASALGSSRKYNEALRKIKTLTINEQFGLLFNNLDFTRFLIDRLQEKDNAPFNLTTIAQALGTQGSKRWLEGRSDELKLLEAVNRGDSKTVKELLNKGVNVNSKDDSGTPALILAAESLESGDKNIVELLLAKGADINAQDNYGNTALILTSLRGKRNIVELLIARGADVNVQKKNGTTALITAIRNGYRDIGELLIKKGADVNAQNNLGQTALIWATQRKNKEMIELLKKHGAKE